MIPCLDEYLAAATSQPVVPCWCELPADLEPLAMEATPSQPLPVDVWAPSPTSRSIEPAIPRGPNLIERAIASARNWLLGGNVIEKNSISGGETDPPATVAQVSHRRSLQLDVACTLIVAVWVE